MKEELLEAIYGTVERLERKVDELSASPKNTEAESTPVSVSAVSYTHLAWLLALAEEVSKETVHQVTVAVKTQEVGRVLRLGGRSLRCAVSAESGDDADFARLLVTDYQHVLFITLFLLYHNCKFLMVNTVVI